MKNSYKLILSIVIVLTLSFVVHAANNYVQPGDTITLTWANVSPTAGDPVIKCSSKAGGGIIGVALNGTATAAESVQVATKGVFDLSVKATGGAMYVGDYVFAAVGGLGTCTATLDDTSSGLIFGVLLEAISSGETDTVNVMLLQPSHL